MNSQTQSNTDPDIFFRPLQLGALELRNRLIMAPMTRSRASDDGVPGELTATYYSQRGGAGLILSEGVFPSSMGKGYVRTPGICTDEQVAAWKKVTDAVHAAGSAIFCQIMHCGRISHPTLLPGGATPVAPSAVRPTGQTWTNDGMVDFVTPRALETDEIEVVISEYADAASWALGAGFDGVELHAASGYLPEQFLCSSTNQRSDEYGGSIANRVRFPLEALDALIDVVGADRVGIKLVPEMGFNDLFDDTPRDTYSYLVEQVDRRKPAYLHIVGAGSEVDYPDLFRSLFSGTCLVGGGLTAESGASLLTSARADAVVYGQLFLANPDLPERFRRGAALNEPDNSTFYTPGPDGYIDYPALDGIQA